MPFPRVVPHSDGAGVVESVGEGEVERARRGVKFLNAGGQPEPREIAMAGMFMVLFLTANGIAQSVRERFAEFATLKTIGFSDRGVLALVFLEAALPCLLGAALGVALASWIATVLPRVFPPGQGVPIPIMTGSVYVWALVAAAAVALTGITAHRRKDGEYLVFVEEDYKAKALLYRWRP